MAQRNKFTSILSILWNYLTTSLSEFYYLCSPNNDDALIMPFSKKLIVEYDFDFYLMGIVSPAREYKLAWLINKTLDIHLVKKQDLVINFINNKLIISNFKSETAHCVYRLLRNQSVGEPSGKPYYLLPELKNFDFLLMISDESSTVVVDDLLENIRQLPEVYYVMQADLSQLDSKENLIF